MESAAQRYLHDKIQHGRQNYSGLSNHDESYDNMFPAACSRIRHGETVFPRRMREQPKGSSSLATVSYCLYEREDGPAGDLQP